MAERLAIHKDGRIFIAYHKRGVMALDVASGRVKPVLEQVRRERASREPTFTSPAMAISTSPIRGKPACRTRRARVLLRRNGNVDCLIDNVPSPNGLVLSKDEKTLFLAVTRRQTRSGKWHPDGTTSRSGFHQHVGGRDLTAWRLPTRIDCRCPCRFGRGLDLRQVGRAIYRLVSCEQLSTTNLAFGGAKPRALSHHGIGQRTILRLTSVRGTRVYSHM